MPNIFNQQPDLTAHTTAIRGIKAFKNEQIALTFNQNIFRPAGGGQPHDLGAITVGDKRSEVLNVFKQDGDTWVMTDRASLGEIEMGDMIFQEVDKARRTAMSRSHSLTHLIMAAARHVLTDFNSKGASIADEGFSVKVKLRTKTPITKELMTSISCLTRHFVQLDNTISIVSAKSVAEASKYFRHWRVDSDLSLNGKIQIVSIEGIDANPCSGSHVKSTGEVGPFEFTEWTQTDDMELHISARRTSEWKYSFNENSLQNIPNLDLLLFAN